MGAVCIMAAIVFMFTKLIYFLTTGDDRPILDGRGQSLLYTGSILLGATGFDGVLSSLGKGGNK